MKNFIKKCIPTTWLNILIGQMAVWLLRGKTSHNVTADISVLIAAPGGGNIGDQAMLESFLHNVSGNKLILTTNDNPLQIPPNYAANTDVKMLAGLIYGEPHTFLRDIVTFIKLMPRCRSLSVIGADVMDGGYNPHASVMRSYMALFAAMLGVKSRIMGFSWNAAPDKKALSALKKAGQAGVTLLVRDPISYQRLDNHAVMNLQLAADVVFANPTQQEQGIEDILNECHGKKVAIVNASGLIAKAINQTDEYQTIIDKLLADQYAIVLLPHVIRKGANDLTICAEIAARYPDIYFVDRLLEPDQIKRLAQAAQLVVTGRMHLSIMSINAGVPAIVLSTQGKVDGLMQFFSVPELSLEPKPGFGVGVVTLIDKVQNNYPHYKSCLSQNIDAVRRLSDKNFQ